MAQSSMGKISILPPMQVSKLPEGMPTSVVAVLESIPEQTS